MGNRKQKMAMLSMMAFASSVYTDGYNDLFMEEPKPKTKRKPKPIKKIIPKGMKEFFYGTEKIYALNKKNADRKARKKGLIIQSVIKTNE